MNFWSQNMIFLKEGTILCSAGIYIESKQSEEHLTILFSSCCYDDGKLKDDLKLNIPMKQTKLSDFFKEV